MATGQRGYAYGGTSALRSRSCWRAAARGPLRGAVASGARGLTGGLSPPWTSPTSASGTPESPVG
eukprot:3294230-Alexandrium_andersonii.AAC.1